MILKNPYGYLIKHFKLIHLFLLGIYIYLAIHVNSILQFYKQYADGIASKLDATSYINNFYLVCIIISIAVCTIIYALMRYKHKPRLLYLILIAFYIVVGIMINVSYKGLNVIYLSVIETKTLRLYRDLLQILIIFQFISIAFVLVRALGFDIKKFNFVKDLNELDLNEKDIEEIEVTLGGTESIQRKVNRRFREFRYYYLENKSFVIIILVVVACFLLSSIVVDKEVINKVYNEGEVISTDSYRFSVLNTYVTSLDWQGKSFVNSDTTFVVVRMNLGVNNTAMKFNTSNLVLKIGKQVYTCDDKYAARFSDLGTAYSGAVIRNQNTYLFIYNILVQDMNKKMVLEYAGNKKIVLSPVNVETVKDTKKYILTNKIDLSQTSLQSGYFSVSSFEIRNQFAYSYQYEVLGQANTANLTISNGDGGVLLLLIDSSLPFAISKYDFLSNFGKLKYEEEGVEKVSAFSNKTPGSYNDGLYLAVDSGVLNASHIWFEFAIRDKKIVYNLK